MSLTLAPNLADENVNLDSYWMQKAYEQALIAQSLNEIPVGAVLVADNALVAAGYNQMILSHDPSAHAEVIALRKAGQNIKNYRFLETTLYVTLEPCIMCAGTLIHARVKRVVFGAYDMKTGAAGSFIDIFTQENLNHYIEVQGGVLQAQCQQLLSDFFKRRRKERKAEKQERTLNHINNDI
ncbi:tRNA adenosine(34) deaminase TadA [Thorsellia kenyensis]|uniref:tRNA-specific adenosine deaminase n=1 Tax=Thorsellia kenyensis TaxID=1549888 RepID=A0ABV6CEA5_9GAMM